MYLIINNERFTVSQRQVTKDTIRYLTVTPKVDNISGKIQMYTNEDVLMSEDNADVYLRKYYTGTLLVLTNIPEPVPPQPEPDVRTAAEKRQDAYSQGYINSNGEYKDWHIEWNERHYTCDELSQLGMRYSFREEPVADEIRALVEARVNEIRAFYPDENIEIN